MKLKIAILFAMAVAVVACQKNMTGPKNGQSQRLTIFLTDHQALNFDKVFIDIQKLEIKVEDNGVDSLGGWFTLNIRPGVYDILKFRNGIDTLFATGTIPGGKLQKIRMTLGSNNSVVQNGNTFPLTLHSDKKVIIANLDDSNVDVVAPDQLHFWIDFDAGRSIKERNNQFELESHIKIFSRGRAGEIEGRVLPVDAKPMVFAINGSDTATAKPEREGEFRIVGLNAGNYKLLVTATAGNYRDTIINNIIVRTGEDTKVPTIVLK